MKAHFKINQHFPALWNVARQFFLSPLGRKISIMICKKSIMSLFLIMQLSIIALPQSKTGGMKSGEYLSVDYISKMKQSKSIKKAGSAIIPFLAVVESVSVSKSKILYGNFHEGWEDTSPIRVISGNEFELFPALGKRIRFKHVGNANKWVTSTIFNGKYYDSRESLYVIEDSVFITPEGRVYTFSFILDNSVERIFFDHIYLDDQVYHYQFLNNLLYLYSTYEDSTAIYQVNNTPVWAIKKKNIHTP